MPESGLETNTASLLDQGIEGFWNDMNEPAIFYSSEGMEEAKKLAGEFYQDKEGKIHYLENAGRAKRYSQTTQKITADFIIMWMAKRSVTTRYITCLATI